VASRSSIVATRTTGWSLSTDQTAARIAGASAAASGSRVRTTSDIALSAKAHWSMGMYTASDSLSANDICFTSPTTPTIV
jgi:hypothetical protein